MSNPRISVIMSVYNGEKYIKEAIVSVLNQTFTDFEFIIINDGSKDGSVKIIEEHNDSRIKLINQENQGLAFSLNKAIAISEGDYIVRFDADDVCVFDRFEKQLAYMEKNREVSVLGTSVEYIDNMGYYLGRSFPITWPYTIKYTLKSFGNVIAHPSVIIRKKDLIRIGGYCEQLHFKQDYHLWNKFLRKGALIVNSTEVLIKYRINDNSISSRYNLEKKDIFLFKKILQLDDPPSQMVNEFICSLEKNGKAKRNSDIRYLENKLYTILTILFNKGTACDVVCFFKNCFVVFKILLKQLHLYRV